MGRAEAGRAVTELVAALREAGPGLAEAQVPGAVDLDSVPPVPGVTAVPGVGILTPVVRVTVPRTVGAYHAETTGTPALATCETYTDPVTQLVAGRRATATVSVRRMAPGAAAVRPAAELPVMDQRPVAAEAPVLHGSTVNGARRATVSTGPVLAGMTAEAAPE